MAEEERRAGGWDFAIAVVDLLKSFLASKTLWVIIAVIAVAAGLANMDQIG